MEKDMIPNTTTDSSPVANLSCGQESIARVLPVGQESIATVRVAPGESNAADGAPTPPRSAS